jgi:hypothetical protein
MKNVALFSKQNDTSLDFIAITPLCCSIGEAYPVVPVAIITVDKNLTGFGCCF